MTLPWLASTVDTRLAALEHSCALLSSILKNGPPTPNTVQGSTSTLTVSSTLSAQGSALGKRD